ncbi:hypothetical protein B2G88_13450 [Natronolimnobius baerhuensis]|uniref:Uncharacterized protein n=2 Tax=Natronolimnobius baerhuensis TaxID=253108 RepID=A0A202E5E2_9EURY|nr:hypothetical protein [Natronolimnobius baerhuensis]OVE83449.1 hypothetical protein B2G88_13450 [Natronolimnobius baerhuensis]
MLSDQRPIPPEALPPGWGALEFCQGRFVYRYRQPPIELIADETSADRCHPGLGLHCYWELRYRYSIGDYLHTDQIGRVSTRHAALEGLLECMHRVHERADALEDPFDVSAVLEQVSLSDFIPGTDSKPD